MASRATVRAPSDVPVVRWSDAVRGEVGFRTLFGDDTTETDSLTAGVTEMEPGDWLGRHRHDPAEVYYIIEGDGTVVLDGDELAVGSGSAVFIPGNLEHGIRNTGDRVLRFFYAFPVSSFADVDYRFTGHGDDADARGERVRAPGR
jgi:mannose-6-phosphate isomerase-like protein (cupin superfamily)